MPVYNEIASIHIIRRNIRLARKQCPRSLFFISDNNSDDGTSEQLSLLEEENNGFLIVFKQQHNLGFSRNLLTLQKLPDNAMITMIGANDYLSPRGLKYLATQLSRNPDAKLFITNWSYYTDASHPIASVFYTGDVKTPFQTSCLEEFFRKHRYAPNGIMQYTCTKDTLLAMRDYVLRGDANPQLGVFFEAFPCKAVVLADPPLTFVKHAEDLGWRSSRQSIVSTHFTLYQEVVAHLDKARSRGSISKHTHKVVSKLYLNAVVRTMYVDWADWTGGPTEKKKFIVETFDHLLNSIQKASLMARIRLTLYFHACQARYILTTLIQMILCELHIMLGVVRRAFVAKQ